MIELEVACKDPADLFVQIIAHTQGAWTVDDVIRAIRWIDEQTKPKLSSAK